MAYPGGQPVTIVGGQAGGQGAGTAANPFVTTQASGSGNATTIADGADVAEGSRADAAYSGTGSSTVIAALKGIYAALFAPTPAGTNTIGKVGIDQTTPGSTNLVYNQPATSGTAPTTGSFTATGNSALFSAIPGHTVWVKLSGTFVGTVQAQRCSDGTATTAQAITVGGMTYAQFTAPCQEAVSSEDDTGVAYRLACIAFTSGTINYQIGHK